MILLIDTTSSKIKLAIGEKLIEIESSKQSVDLPKAVQKIMAEKPQLAAIGVFVGPGSFTGIRLGIAFAKGFAMGLKIPVVGLSVFDLFKNEVLAIKSDRGDFYVKRGNVYKIEQELPADAHLIDDYNMLDATAIVHARMMANPQPVIPLYIRPSYVD